MRFFKITIVVGMLSIVLLTYSCLSKRDPNELVESRYLGESHKAGKDCFSCHNTKGIAKGLPFSVAGSIDLSGENENVKEINGAIAFNDRNDSTSSPLLVLPIDRSGNFFTNRKLDMSKGYRLKLINQNEVLSEMKALATGGNCFVCHQKEDKPLRLTSTK